ncbi:MAG: replicative DNA helicase [Calditrichaceae bacterium]|nr:replicative DNA helicase [Calditrichaceae bacterium]MBN2709921.1 replicative DNA helicase [Calditrichaceae bacterium]RQV92673.1 MAG: replicative DNA helicase [Calditrichota bacterium]
MSQAETDQQVLRIPPQAIEVEQAVLGALLLDSEAVAKAVESLEPGFFYRKSHQLIFEAMTALFEKNREIDLITLAEELNKRSALDDVGGNYYLAEVANSVPSSANIEYHLEIIKQKALSRRLIKDCEVIIQRAFDQNEEIDELLDFSEQQIFEISEKRLKKGFASINPILHQTFERIDKLYHSSRSGVTGVATGYKKLDELTAGFQPSDLIVLAGRPSMGKTAFALNIARNAAIDYGIPVGIFSLEMSSEALVLRLLCTESKVNQMSVRTGKLSKEEMSRLTDHVAKLMNAPIYIDDSPSLNVLELRAKARRLKAEHNIQMLIIDYLQLMEGTKAENRQQEITHISRSIKGIAKELDIPVLALSQLSRAVESRDRTKKPQLSDLRESGAIEQDADVVMFVYRPEYYQIMEFEDTGMSTHNMCEIMIGKQRNGPTGNTRLTFLKEYGKFGDPDLSYDSGVLSPAEF